MKYPVGHSKNVKKLERFLAEVSAINDNLPYTSNGSKFLCSTDTQTHCKVDLQDSPVNSGTKKQFNVLCEEHAYIFSQHAGDMQHK